MWMGLGRIYEGRADRRMPHFVGGRCRLGVARWSLTSEGLHALFPEADGCILGDPQRIVSLVEVMLYSVSGDVRILG